MLCPCADQESIKNDQFRGHTPHDWRPLAWYIHDHLQQYSEMVFFAKNAAFNLTWRKDKPLRKISCKASPHKGTLTEPRAADLSSHYPGFPEFKG